MIAPRCSVLTLTLIGCASSQQPCDRVDACPGALVCQVGRCAAVESTPVRPESSRKVLDPVDALFVDGASREGMTSELRVASRGGGSALVLLRFEPAWVGVQVERAYLLLEPTEGAFPALEPMEIQVSPVLESWSSLTPVPLPALGQPESRASLVFTPPAPLRVEVTELLRSWTQRSGRIHGIALRISGLGARLSWGDLTGTYPRLDLYLR
ncbi:MAG: hypothetical protein RMJ98_10080 [Myxococcales bacterium]|nr:hypothetical protein [Polyangiaceae bacterium]MDW8249637.1 hypothetical protein [Myxococcales bacterium]